MTIAVVGAGLAGLAACWELRRAGAAVALLDAARHAGGTVVTEHPEPGWVVEGGADGFLGADPDIPTVAAEAGITDRIVAQRATRSLVWDGRALAPLATGAAAELLAIDVRGLDLRAGFKTFLAGMGEIVNALLAGADLRVESVTSLDRSPRGIRLHTQAGTTLDCSGVILAVPAYAAATLVASLSSAAAPVLAAIPYHPSTNVSIAFRREQITHALDASGFATAPAVTGPVRACTFASSKFPGRAPDGYALLRAFVTASSRDAATVALATLAPILGIRGAPLWSRTFSWSQGIPRYGVAHRDDVAAVRQALARSAPLALAGAGYDGAGVSACVRSGRNAARELLARL